MVAAVLPPAAAVKTKITEKTVSGKPLRNYFLHVPKTGGTSATRALVAAGIEGCEMLGKGAEASYAMFTRTHPECADGVYYSEGAYNTVAERMFTTIRLPHDHIISMYYHCAESLWHKPWAKHLPDRSTWLSFWAAYARKHKNDDGEFFLNRPLHPERDNDAVPGSVFRYHCYNPVGMLYQRLGAPDQLAERFAVIGLQNEMTLTVCLVITYIKGSVIPACNCTHGVPQTKLRMPHISHGVKHHGSDMRLAPEEELNLREIAYLDNAIYDKATTIFWNEVAATESKHKVKFCTGGESADTIEGKH